MVLENLVALRISRSSRIRSATAFEVHQNASVHKNPRRTKNSRRLYNTGGAPRNLRLTEKLELEKPYRVGNMAGIFIPFYWPKDANRTWDNFNISHLGSADFRTDRRGTQYVEDPTVQLMRLVTEVWLSMPIALLGIVGNLASLVVLVYHRRQSPSKKLQSILVQLQALAVVDTLVLVNVLLLRSLRYVAPVEYVRYHTYIYPWLLPTTYVLRMANTWLTVLLTVDRYIAVCWPLHARRLCTIRRTYVEMAAIVVLSVVYCIPRYFESSIK